MCQVTCLWHEQNVCRGKIIGPLQQFLVHYLPPAVIVASMEPPVWSAREVTLLMGGLALFAVYLSVENPDEIYGVSIDSAVASGMGLGFVILAVYGLWLFAGR